MLPIPKHYSENMKEIVSLLLKKDPNSRPSIEDIFQMDFIQNKIKIFKFEADLELYNENVSNTNNIYENTKYPKGNNKNNIDDIRDKNHEVKTLNEWGSSLFEFGFGNLLKENEEIGLNLVNSENTFKENKNSNLKGFSPAEKNPSIMNNSKFSSEESMNPTRYDSKFQNMEKKYQKLHKYSPSYNNMNDILSSVNSFSIVGSLSNNQTNLSKFSKNQNSFPEYQGLKLEKSEKESPVNSLNTEVTNSPMKLTMEQSKIS